MKGLYVAGMLFLYLYTPLAFSSTEIIKFGANESPPYWSSMLEKQGMCGEIMHAISKVANLKAEIEFTPLKRLIDDDNNNDLGNPEFYMKIQEFASIVPIAIYRVNVVYYRPNHKEEIKISSLDDLKGYKIGVIQGVLTEQAYFKNAGITFETSYTEDSLIKKVKRGRVDLVLSIDLVAQSSIKKLYPNEIGDFEFIDVAGSTSPIALMISENHPNAKSIGKEFSAGLNEVIKSGAYKRILEKYYGVGKIPNGWFDELNKFQRLYDFHSE